jgi:hypothetical protein
VPAPLSLVLWLVTVATVLVAARVAVRRWIRWANLAADYATTDILLASDIDSAEAVSQLRLTFDAWSRVVNDGTSRFCQDEDAHRIQYVDPPELAGLACFDDEHRYIVEATRERVQRLRDLAKRLERGETRLRRYWVPRVS